VGVQAEDAAGDGGAQAAWSAGQGGGAFLAPDSGSEYGERDHESKNQGEGQASDNAFHDMQGATERADVITAWLD